METTEPQTSPLFSAVVSIASVIVGAGGAFYGMKQTNVDVTDSGCSDRGGIYVSIAGSKQSHCVCETGEGELTFMDGSWHGDCTQSAHVYVHSGYLRECLLAALIFSIGLMGLVSRRYFLTKTLKGFHPQRSRNAAPKSPLKLVSEQQRNERIEMLREELSDAHKELARKRIARQVYWDGNRP
eukprot:g3944.t1